MNPNSTHPSRLVFLIGCFRSGTSLLHKLIHRHPDIALMWECDALKFLPTRVRPGWTDRLNLWNGAIERHSIDTRSLPDNGSRDAAALALFRQYGDSMNARVVGEKSPYYADIIRSLAKRFPLARFIILTREPADVIDSVRRAGTNNRFFSKPWMPLRVLKEAGRIRRDLDWLRRSGYSVKHVRFETLINDPEPTCQSIWGFLGLERKVNTSADRCLESIPEGLHHHNVLNLSVDSSKNHRLVNHNAAAYQALWAHRFLTDLPNAHSQPTPFKMMTDEALFQTCKAFDGVARIMFHQMPVQFLQVHRRRTKHAVGMRDSKQKVS